MKNGQKKIKIKLRFKRHNEESKKKEAVKRRGVKKTGSLVF